MSDKPSRSEELLTSSLRELARSLPRSASPESTAALAQAFRRHHSRHRILRIAAIAAVIVAVSSGSVWLRTVLHESARTRPTTGNTVVAGQVASGEEVFTALPSFAFETPGEELRVIRVEMPVSSLRMLGARVNDELSTRSIVADLLVGTDGTPYAFRIIS